MSRRHRRDRQRDEYGQSWEMAAALWDGPRTIDEIVDHFRSYVRFLGLFSVTERLERHDRARAVRMVAFVRETLEDLSVAGLCVKAALRADRTGAQGGEHGTLGTARNRCVAAEERIALTSGNGARNTDNTWKRCQQSIS
jgi:hypothetical protein